MWHKQEYNNADALRDAIGMYIIYPDNLTEDGKLDILKRITRIMPDYGYIIKNKWWINSGLLSKEYNEGCFKENRPIGINEERWVATSDDMNNFSVSGFIGLWGREKASWFEVQFLSENAHSKKKEEDSLYKVRTAIEAFMRWPKYRLPSEIYNLVAERCKWRDASGIIWELIESWFLTAHTMPGGDEIIFSSKKYCGALEKLIFPKMKRIYQRKDFWYLYELLHDYIMTPSSISKDVAFSINGTSSQPSLLDQ